MPWQAFLGLSILAEVCGRLIQRVLLRDDKSDPIAYLIVFLFVAGFLIGIYAVVTGFHIPPLGPILPNLLLMPVLYGAANVFIFKSLKSTEASVFTVLFASRALWLIFGALIFLHERFISTQFLGAFLIIAAVVLVSWKRQKISLQRGELYAILAALLFAVAILNDSFIVKTFDVVSYEAITYIATSLFIWLIYRHKTREVLSLARDTIIGKIAFLSIAYSISSVGYFMAYKLGNNAAQLGALYQLSSVLTVLFAIVLLNEKSNVKTKIFAGLLSFAGMLLVK
ncbi:hypothetical protein A2Z00_05460 [Candidatus Gottesmanbacteria bacterium RBG_13_45_10]|uniref:EamA domain-containing protein n=1 Tax=Candidatus Gottesmanbacteria bacterium RBG_13_45_10 TaxID=1798370 RepID=A0A1F5ZGZ0_9BACT|nr:MAG: hypothetical protein A2Z00_05460 [Candidatus Gottesmanbacteria bacterium RBG_13_45_10]